MSLNLKYNLWLSKDILPLHFSIFRYEKNSDASREIFRSFPYRRPSVKRLDEVELLRRRRNMNAPVEWKMATIRKV